MANRCISAALADALNAAKVAVLDGASDHGSARQFIFVISTATLSNSTVTGSNPSGHAMLPPVRFECKRRDSPFAKFPSLALALLIHGVESWPPLCAFLGVPVPADPFPRTNDRGELWDRVSGKK